MDNKWANAKLSNVGNGGTHRDPRVSGSPFLVYSRSMVTLPIANIQNIVLNF